MAIKLTFFDKLNDWLTSSGPENEVVISSRVRLARNLENAPFPGHAQAAELKMIFETVFTAVQKIPHYKKANYFALAEQPRLVRELLKERYLISQDIINS